MGAAVLTTGPRQAGEQASQTHPVQNVGVGHDDPQVHIYGRNQPALQLEFAKLDGLQAPSTLCCLGCRACAMLWVTPATRY
jgi:hypothetical protein